MKNKILNWVFNKNRDFFEDKIESDFFFRNSYVRITKIPEPIINLENIFEENKHYFELLLIKDFTGYIPKNINEPAMKIFEESGELFERWTLWQSWYINNKALNDPMKITFYNGMMVYLKVLNTIAKVHKKNYIPEIRKTEEVVVEPSFIEQALSDIKGFNDVIKNNKERKDNEGKESSDGQDVIT